MVKRLHELPSKDWWAVVTALRGPDFRPSWGLKCVFTARIRAWVASLFKPFPSIHRLCRARSYWQLLTRG